MGDDQQPRSATNWWGLDKDGKSRTDNASDGMGAVNQAYTGGAGLYTDHANLTPTGVMGLFVRVLTPADLLRPAGLNYDKYSSPTAPSEGPMAGTPEAAA